MARDGAAPAEWAAPVRRRPARRAASGLLRVVGVMGHLPCADEPGHAEQRRWAGPGSPGRLASARGLGLRPDRASPRRDRGHADRPAPATTPDAGSAPAWSASTRRGTTSLRGALTLTAPLVTVRDVRAGTGVGYGHTWIAPTDRPGSACCRSGTPTGCRARPPAAPRCWSAASAARWSGGSPWTWRSSTSGTSRRCRRRRRSPSSARATHGEPTVARLGRLGRTPSSTRSSPASAPGSTESCVPPPPSGAVTSRTRVAVDRRRPELRARGLAGLRRGDRRGRSTRRGYDVVRLDHRPATACGATDEDRPLGLAGAVEVLRTCDVVFPPCTVRAARTAPSPRCATWPACRTSAPASARARWRWTSGRPSWSPARSASPPRPARC